ncbi:hypothetical protein T440DRAFT_93259 [Plenodomus tracheiphilus IPT5]|uniref:Uncharacterized protein n=1 Tax=Plenodomus tracheiphilus IPT5 TaxID=1408161 RepID=A0A6A7BNA6_9PLEO|nr:hypothetical protein T440DRAFT_93259 [Plenodomus tracheiphilus IPT5]
MHCLRTLDHTCCGVTGYNDTCHRCHFLHVSPQIPLLQQARIPSVPNNQPRRFQCRVQPLSCLMSSPSGLHVTCHKLQLPRKTAVTVTGLRGQMATSADATTTSV